MTAFERELLPHLLTFLTEQRKERFTRVLAERTRHVTVVLEDVFQSHNISAVLRSCDAFGIQDLHVVESENEYQPVNEIALGSEQWLSVHRHRSTSACLRTLRTSAYRILATAADPDGRPLTEIDARQPIALWFGTEKDGLSRELKETADDTVTIPMYGFVESLNVSVAVALCLHTLARRLREGHVDWRLPDDERSPLVLDWCRQSIPNSVMIEQRFRQEWEACRRNTRNAGGAN